MLCENWHQMGWTKPEEGLPPPRQRVLLHVDAGPFELQVMGKISTEDGWLLTGPLGSPRAVDDNEITIVSSRLKNLNGRTDYDIEVLAWMPIPDPPS